MTNKNDIKKEVLAAIEAGSSRTETPRKYLGFSEIGKDDRYLWLKFRFCLDTTKEDEDAIFDESLARRSRVFEMGHEYERKINAWLENGGLVVTNDQAEISLLNGHFKGHTDGDLVIYIDGAMTEKKSANKASFNRFIAVDTVREWDEVYWYQAQAYGGHFKYKYIIFIVICKDTQRIAIKVEDVETWVYDSCEFKAEQIIFNNDALPYSTWPGPDWYESKFLGDYNQNIYWGKTVPKPGCRNCKHSNPSDLGEWVCSFGSVKLSLEKQIKPDCSEHRYLECLTELPLHDSGVINVSSYDEDIANKFLSSQTIYDSLQARAIEGGNMPMFEKNKVINKSMAEAFDPKRFPME